jgi:hypothetical protein
MLAEIILREAEFYPAKYLPPPLHNKLPERIPVLYVEWICLQNPKESFSERRPRLPGQAFPGLGLGAEVLGLVAIIARRLGKQGLLSTPERFHNAAIYHRAYLFATPEDEGIYQSITRDCRGKNFAEVAWGVELEYLMDRGNGRAFKWKGSPMFLDLTGQFEKLLEHPTFQNEVDRSKRNHEYSPTWVEGQFYHHML